MGFWSKLIDTIMMVDIQKRILRSDHKGERNNTPIEDYLREQDAWREEDEEAFWEEEYLREQQELDDYDDLMMYQEDFLTDDFDEV